MLNATRNFSVLIVTIFLILLVSIIFSSVASAHPGNTASDGCHYCRTNCSKWGEVQDARHCHGGSTTTTYAPNTTYVAPSYSKEYNGVTYYSESAYNAAVNEYKFQNEHKDNIKETFQSILNRPPTNEEIEEWFNYSRNLTAISNALLATEEYQEIVFQKEHRANVKKTYEEIIGTSPSGEDLNQLSEMSRDINEIKEYISNNTEKYEVDDKKINLQPQAETASNNIDWFSFIVGSLMILYFLGAPVVIVIVLVLVIVKRK